MTERIRTNVVPKGTVKSEQKINKEREMAKALLLLFLLVGLSMSFFIFVLNLIIAQEVDMFWILLTITCGSIGLSILFGKTCEMIDEIRERLLKGEGE
jgi:hypothetical protein